MTLSVYIDESYNEKESSVLCVSGYVFRTLAANEFARSWKPYLRNNSLKHFHMVDCAHRKEEFEGWKTDDCARVETRLIFLTRTYSAYGFAVTVDTADYNELLANQFNLKSAYSFALFIGLVMVRRWMEAKAFNGECSYFFEQGHPHQSDANGFMNWIFESEEVRARYRYGQHSFLPKETPWLHPADMLAWHWCLETNRSFQANRRPVRADLLALVRPQDMTIDYSSRNLSDLKDFLTARHADIEAHKA